MQCRIKFTQKTFFIYEIFSLSNSIFANSNPHLPFFNPILLRFLKKQVAFPCYFRYTNLTNEAFIRSPHILSKLIRFRIFIYSIFHQYYLGGILMKFGYFDDSAKEYVITTPDTPLPWINYLGSRDFFSLISNTCGGYSFYKATAPSLCSATMLNQNS